MTKLYFETEVHGHYKDVFARFDQKLFEALKPPMMSLNVVRFDGSAKGNEVHLEIGLFGVTQSWISVITTDFCDEDQCFFIDEGQKIPSPLKSWRHRHVVRKISQDRCLIIDDIEYTCHGGKVIESLMHPILYGQFALRAPVYKRYFST